MFEPDPPKVGEGVFEGFGVAGQGDLFGGFVFGDQAAVVVAVLHIDPVPVGFEQVTRSAFGVEVLTRRCPTAGGVGVVVFGDVVEIARER